MQGDKILGDFQVVILYFYYVYLHVCAYACMCAHRWTSEDNMPESILSFHHVGLSDESQVISLGDHHP